MLVAPGKGAVTGAEAAVPAAARLPQEQAARREGGTPDRPAQGERRLPGVGGGRLQRPPGAPDAALAP